MYQRRLIIKVEMGKQMSATTVILYYKNQFNTELLLAKTHFLSKLVISNIKKLLFMGGRNTLQWDFTINANCAVRLEIYLRCLMAH